MARHALRNCLGTVSGRDDAPPSRRAVVALLCSVVASWSLNANAQLAPSQLPSQPPAQPQPQTAARARTPTGAATVQHRTRVSAAEDPSLRAWVDFLVAVNPEPARPVQGSTEPPTLARRPAPSWLRHWRQTLLSALRPELRSVRESHPLTLAEVEVLRLGPTRAVRGLAPPASLETLLAGCGAPTLTARTLWQGPRGDVLLGLTLQARCRSAVDTAARPARRPGLVRVADVTRAARAARGAAVGQAAPRSRAAERAPAPAAPSPRDATARSPATQVRWRTLRLGVRADTRGQVKWARGLLRDSRAREPWPLRVALLRKGQRAVVPLAGGGWLLQLVLAPPPTRTVSALPGPTGMRRATDTALPRVTLALDAQGAALSLLLCDHVLSTAAERRGRGKRRRREARLVAAGANDAVDNRPLTRASVWQLTTAPGRPEIWTQALGRASRDGAVATGVAAWLRTEGRWHRMSLPLPRTDAPGVWTCDLEADQRTLRCDFDGAGRPGVRGFERRRFVRVAASWKERP